MQERCGTVTLKDKPLTVFGPAPEIAQHPSNDEALAAVRSL
jgi:hypothetical protein